MTGSMVTDGRARIQREPSSRPSPRRTLATFGYRERRVRVVVETGGERVLVIWRESGARTYRSWQNAKAAKAEALAFAEGLADTLGKPRPQQPITLRELWLRFRETEFPHLRPRTQQLYEQRWATWELFVGMGAVADSLTFATVDRFREEMSRRGTAVNQVKETVKTAKIVLSWGESRDLTTRNRIQKYLFKTHKDEPVNEPAEYTAEERDRLIAQFNPRLAVQWRPWALLMLLGHHGVRERAALHLKWEDIDADSAEVIWRKEFDKLGREWRQPLTWELVSALAWAQWWRERLGYEGPWVFFSRDSRSASTSDGRTTAGVYRVQSLWAALQKAERGAGIAHKPYRATHGIRRLVAGEVLQRTGDPVLAMHYIGDTDLKVMKRYLKRRDDRLRQVADTWTHQ